MNASHELSLLVVNFGNGTISCIARNGRQGSFEAATGAEYRLKFEPLRNDKNLPRIYQ